MIKLNPVCIDGLNLSFRLNAIMREALNYSPEDDLMDAVQTSAYKSLRDSLDDSLEDSIKNNGGRHY